MKWTNQTILIVEDSPEDYEAMVRAMQRSGLPNPLHHCDDGDDALDYLLRRAKYANDVSFTRPGIILLDLNLPGVDGREVLAEIKQNRELKTIPVIVMTTSLDERDIAGCYAAGANSYVNKPTDRSGFAQVFQRLREYWFQSVVFPKACD